VDLLAASGVFARAQADPSTLVSRLRAGNPRIPEGVWTSFAARIARHETLERIYAPVYAKHLPEDVARGLVAFYRTPVGARYLQAEPLIQGSFAARPRPRPSSSPRRS
jgi:hypothetical protein